MAGDATTISTNPTVNPAIVGAAGAPPLATETNQEQANKIAAKFRELQQTKQKDSENNQLDWDFINRHYESAVSDKKGAEGFKSDAQILLDSLPKKDLDTDTQSLADGLHGAIKSEPGSVEESIGLSGVDQWLCALSEKAPESASAAPAVAGDDRSTFKPAGADKTAADTKAFGALETGVKRPIPARPTPAPLTTPVVDKSTGTATQTGGARVLHDRVNQVVEHHAQEAKDMKSKVTALEAQDKKIVFEGQEVELDKTMKNIHPPYRALLNVEADDKGQVEPFSRDLLQERADEASANYEKEIKGLKSQVAQASGEDKKQLEARLAQVEKNQKVMERYAAKLELTPEQVEEQIKAQEAIAEKAAADSPEKKAALEEVAVLKNTQELDKYIALHNADLVATTKFYGKAQAKFGMQTALNRGRGEVAAQEFQRDVFKTYGEAVDQGKDVKAALKEFEVNPQQVEDLETLAKASKGEQIDDKKLDAAYSNIFGSYGGAFFNKSEFSAALKPNADLAAGLTTIADATVPATGGQPGVNSPRTNPSLGEKLNGITLDTIQAAPKTQLQSGVSLTTVKDKMFIMDPGNKSGVVIDPQTNAVRSFKVEGKNIHLIKGDQRELTLADNKPVSIFLPKENESDTNHKMVRLEKKAEGVEVKSYDVRGGNESEDGQVWEETRTLTKSGEMIEGPKGPLAPGQARQVFERMAGSDAYLFHTDGNLYGFGSNVGKVVGANPALRGHTNGVSQSGFFKDDQEEVAHANNGLGMDPHALLAKTMWDDEVRRSMKTQKERQLDEVLNAVAGGGGGPVPMQQGGPYAGGQPGFDGPAGFPVGGFPGGPGGGPAFGVGVGVGPGGWGVNLGVAGQNFGFNLAFGSGNGYGNGGIYNQGGFGFCRGMDLEFALLLVLEILDQEERNCIMKTIRKIQDKSKEMKNFDASKGKNGTGMLQSLQTDTSVLQVELQMAVTRRQRLHETVQNTIKSVGDAKHNAIRRMV